MAEKIVSPGVFTKEIDASFLPSAIGEIGAAIIGPTVKGPALVPTVVSSYSEFQEKFGDTFKSGSGYYSYLTSVAAQQYLRHSGKLTVVRILDGAFLGASSEVLTSDSSTVTGVNSATGGMAITFGELGERYKITQGSDVFTFIASADGSGDAGDDSIRFFAGVSSSIDGDGIPVGLSAHVSNLVTEINAVAGISFTAVSQSNGLLALTASSAGTSLNGITFVTSSNVTPATFGTAPANGVDTDGFIVGGGTDSAGVSTTSFKLNTIADGAIMNNQSSTATTNNILTSGTRDNLRFEIASKNDAKGTFTLLVRRGDDSIKRKQTLETWNNLSLDPNASNYIGKLIGDSKVEIQGTGTSDPYIKYTGNYSNKSKYIYVSHVKDTIDYLDENGTIRLDSLSSSLPTLGSGSQNGGFTGGDNGYAGFEFTFKRG